MRDRLFLLVPLLLLLGCGGDPNGQAKRTGDRYGGIFNVNETEVLRSIFPLSITRAPEVRIAEQIYQGLVRFDPHDISIKPCLAESWEIDATATVYTFHLRKDVRFHDDPAFPEGKGRLFSADDVVRCFNAICQQGVGDQAFWLFQDRVEGANTTYASGAKAIPVTGVEAIDPNTVRVQLTAPTAGFLQIMAHPGCWIYPQELIEMHGKELAQHAIGTGPFRLNMMNPGEAMVLERNAAYWDSDAEGRPLPYLDGVRITFVPDKGKEIDQFLKGRLSMVTELSLEAISVLADSVDKTTGRKRFILETVPALTVQFFGFNASKPPFNDVRVRRAFALAIDRRVLVDSILQGMAVPAEHGLVPPGLSGYPYDRVPTIPFAPDSARVLLAAAGFPEGRGFPRFQLQVNSDGFGYVRIATEVQNMLARELGIAVSISVVSSNEYYERIEWNKALFWREGWIADHPDPENFLSLIYGKNAVTDTTQKASLNNTRYANPVFDSLFTKARRTMDEGERAKLLANAERIAMLDVPLLPLYHERAIVLLQPAVHDLPVNAIEHLDLSAVWLERATSP